MFLKSAVFEDFGENNKKQFQMIFFTQYKNSQRRRLIKKTSQKNSVWIFFAQAFRSLIFHPQGKFQTHFCLMLVSTVCEGFRPGKKVGEKKKLGSKSFLQKLLRLWFWTFFWKLKVSNRENRSTKNSARNLFYENFYIFDFNSSWKSTQIVVFGQFLEATKTLNVFEQENASKKLGPKSQKP